MLNITSTFGLIGLILYLVGLFYKNKSCSTRVMKIGIFLMAFHILFDFCLGLYDGFKGNPHR